MGNYKKVMITTTRCNEGIRGFRLHTKKLSIHSLRVRFFCFFRVLNTFKKSYYLAIRSLRNPFSARRSTAAGVFRRPIDGERKSVEGRARSLARTNSFYTEAIDDCLEFIKRNSLSLDPRQLHRHQGATPLRFNSV